jgi:predicted HNH restriction endonuclease
MTAEDEKSLILLTAIISIGGNGSKKQVLDEVERLVLMKFTPHDLQFRRTRKELNWRNDLAYIKDHLTNQGYLSNPKWNNWAITESGKKYFATLASRLESQRRFQHFNAEAKPKVEAIVLGEQISDEGALSGESSFIEGHQTQRWSTTYERNPQLRAEAVKLHGVVCMGCGFNFEEKYGAIGSGFIEVHHTKPISSLGGKSLVNPATDLVVLCSNCHSIVHRKQPIPLSLEALKAMLRGNNPNILRTQ